MEFKKENIILDIVNCLANLIDPYEIYDGWDSDGEVRHMDGEDIKEVEEFAKKRLEQHRDKIIWIKKKSENVSSLSANLDFVYIDGAHDYENVKKDLEIYYPLLKKGGILCGHDFGREGLTKAVWEFSKKINKVIKFRWEFGSDWVIIK